VHGGSILEKLGIGFHLEHTVACKSTARGNNFTRWLGDSELALSAAHCKLVSTYYSTQLNRHVCTI
jgi:hypothetical protein